jgi:hypothetical protein
VRSGAEARRKTTRDIEGPAPFVSWQARFASQIRPPFPSVLCLLAGRLEGLKLHAREQERQKAAGEWSEGKDARAEALTRAALDLSEDKDARTEALIRAALDLSFAGIDLRLHPQASLLLRSPTRAPHFSYFELSTGQPTIAREPACYLLAGCGHVAH